MTDSGFSSAASNRSSSAIIRTGLLNSKKSKISNSATTSRSDKENIVPSVQDRLPSSLAYPASSGCKLVSANRFIYTKSHGENSTKDFSPMHMSPISSLAFNFRDLNASGDVAGTPCKRLSLSSTVSLDSQQLIHPSPAVLSFASTVDSSQVAQDDEGCFANNPSLTDSGNTVAKFDHRALQERDPNICNTSVASVGDAQNSYRRFNSISTSSKGRHRHHDWSDEHSRKENNPNFSATKQTHLKYHDRKSCSSSMTSFDDCSPLLPVHAHRSSGFHMSPAMASSPLTERAVLTPSSALEVVSQDARFQRSVGDEFRIGRSSKDPSTPTRSGVHRRMSSLSYHASFSKQQSAFPHGKEELGRSENVPLNFQRGNKRILETPNSSLLFTKRHKRNTTSIIDSNLVRREMAFSSKERKTKSADAMLTNSSLSKELKFSFGPMSSPAQTPSSDDDEPLSHSRLCSSNDADSDGDDVVVTSPGLNQPDADEKLLEKILSDNERARKMATSDDVREMERCGTEAPAGMDGLISGTLLLATAAKESEASSCTERSAKPRKLFRSPSAPLLESSRKSQPDVRKVPHIREGGVPVQMRHRKTVDFRDLSGLSSTPRQEEEHVSLNRSRSASEIEIMRAVDLGCSSDDLIGDFSRVCSLKTVPGKCQDLKYITPLTLMELMENEKEIGSFEIIDCRYPYEHEGGHVVGAHCIWEEEKLFERYLHNPGPVRAAQNKEENIPPLLVFYCEFSSERGPRMARALRSKDRSLNRYPHLHYPEIYILRNGFKNFFFTENTRKYCVPPSYRPMAHADFSRELRMCRIKSKTWAGERSRIALSSRPKRS